MIPVKKVLAPRRRRRVRRIQKHPRTAVSIKVCGTTEGRFPPALVVYKSANLCDNWSNETVYAQSKQGWFDKILFKKWFLMFSFLTSKIRTKYTKKNKLSSVTIWLYFSFVAIEAALINNIYTTPLPLSSTHLMQLLDVSFSSPMKEKWRPIWTYRGWKPVEQDVFRKNNSTSFTWKLHPKFKKRIPVLELPIKTCVCQTNLTITEFRANVGHMSLRIVPRVF